MLLSRFQRLLRLAQGPRKSVSGQGEEGEERSWKEEMGQKTRALSGGWAITAIGRLPERT